MARRKDPTPRGIVGIETVNTTVVVMDADLNRIGEIDGAAVKVVTTDSAGPPRCFVVLANKLPSPRIGRPKTRGVK